MSNERKQWSVKDNDYVWDSFLAGMSNEDIARHIGRTSIAVGVRISKLKTRYGTAKITTGVAGPSRSTKPGRAVLITPDLVRVLLVSCIGASAGLMIGTAILHFYG